MVREIHKKMLLIGSVLRLNDPHVWLITKTFLFFVSGVPAYDYCMYLSSRSVIDYLKYISLSSFHREKINRSKIVSTALKSFLVAYFSTENAYNEVTKKT